MLIQVLTVKGKPMIKVADDATAARIDDVIREILGLQANASPHNWVGNPNDEICKPLEPPVRFRGLSTNLVEP